MSKKCAKTCGICGDNKPPTGNKPNKNEPDEDDCKQ